MSLLIYSASLTLIAAFAAKHLSDMSTDATCRTTLSVIVGVVLSAPQLSIRVAHHFVMLITCIASNI